MSATFSMQQWVRSTQVALLVLAFSAFPIVVTNLAQAQVSQVYKIDDQPSAQDLSIAKKYIPNLVEGTKIYVKHIKSIILFHVSRDRGDIFEKQNSLIFYADNHRDFAVLADLSGEFYYSDVVPDNCEECVAIRFGNLLTQEGVLAITSSGVFLSLGGVKTIQSGDSK